MQNYFTARSKVCWIQPIVETLEEVQLFQDIETSSKALSLHRRITTSEFVISLATVNTLFSLTVLSC